MRANTQEADVGLALGNTEVYLARYVGRGNRPTMTHFASRDDSESSAAGAADDSGAAPTVVVETLYLSISPSLRFSLNADSDATCSAGRVDVGDTMWSDGVGRVIESPGGLYQVGDLIANKPKLFKWPWRRTNRWTERELWGVTYRVAEGALAAEAAEAAEAAKVAKAADGQAGGTSNSTLHSHPEAALGVLGLAAMTAYFGVSDVLAKLAEGEERSQTGGPAEQRDLGTLIVSGASGKVGSIAGQVGRLIGYTRVVGITSTKAKVRHLVDVLGFDAAVLRGGGKTTEELAAEIAAACGLGGDGEGEGKEAGTGERMGEWGQISYFDNVGGDVSEAVAAGCLAEGSAVAICGTMSQMSQSVADQCWTEEARRRGAKLQVGLSMQYGARVYRLLSGNACS